MYWNRHFQLTASKSVYHVADMFTLVIDPDYCRFGLRNCGIAKCELQLYNIEYENDFSQRNKYYVQFEKMK